MLRTYDVASVAIGKSYGGYMHIAHAHAHTVYSMCLAVAKRSMAGHSSTKAETLSIITPELAVEEKASVPARKLRMGCTRVSSPRSPPKSTSVSVYSTRSPAVRAVVEVSEARPTLCASLLGHRVVERQPVPHNACAHCLEPAGETVGLKRLARTVKEDHIRRKRWRVEAGGDDGGPQQLEVVLCKLLSDGICRATTTTRAHRSAQLTAHGIGWDNIGGTNISSTPYPRASLYT
eukprot:7389512-Prymnesium_polylepis.2